jgi:hypothetical protein
MDRFGSPPVYTVAGLQEASIEFIACDNPHATKLRLGPHLLFTSPAKRVSVSPGADRDQALRRTKQALTTTAGNVTMI